MSKTFHVVAIDGGAGTGKSTTASLLSKRLITCRYRFSLSFDNQVFTQ